MTNFTYAIELDKKSQAQAMKDLEISKVQASVLLKERLKHYDLNRLPPQYQELLKRHLFGNVPTQDELKALKAKYDKVIADTLKSAAKGPGGDIKRLEKLFSDIVSGKVQYASKRIPFSPSGNIVSKINSNQKAATMVAKKAKLVRPTSMKGIQNIIYQVHPSAKDPNAEKALARFISANKGKNKSNTIFSIHSKTYIDDIYKKIK
jgi:hypothetical protein